MSAPLRFWDLSVLSARQMFACKSLCSGLASLLQCSLGAGAPHSPWAAALLGVEVGIMLGTHTGTGKTPSHLNPHSHLVTQQNKGADTEVCPRVSGFSTHTLSTSG